MKTYWNTFTDTFTDPNDLFTPASKSILSESTLDTYYGRNVFTEDFSWSEYTTGQAAEPDQPNAEREAFKQKLEQIFNIVDELGLTSPHGNAMWDSSEASDEELTVMLGDLQDLYKRFKNFELTDQERGWQSDLLGRGELPPIPTKYDHEDLADSRRGYRIDTYGNPKGLPNNSDHLEGYRRQYRRYKDRQNNPPTEPPPAPLNTPTLPEDDGWDF